MIDDYLKYRDKQGDRLYLYRLVAKEYEIKNALYPGSYIDISPSLVIPSLFYIDNFKGCIKFFNNENEIIEFINLHKEYDENVQIKFYNQDYYSSIDIPLVDLIISQYAGFVSMATKKYLKINGILLCNDSHGDASLLNLDNDFELIAVIESDLRLSHANLNQYFQLKNSKPNREKILSQMKGLNYTVKAENYIFRKIR